MAASASGLLQPAMFSQLCKKYGTKLGGEARLGDPTSCLDLATVAISRNLDFIF